MYPGAAIVPTSQVGQYTLNKVGDKIGPKKREGTIITTSLWPKPCQKPGGDQINRLSILNKVSPATHQLECMGGQEDCMYLMVWAAFTLTWLPCMEENTRTSRRCARREAGDSSCRLNCMSDRHRFAD